LNNNLTSTYSVDR